MFEDIHHSLVKNFPIFDDPSQLLYKIAMGKLQIDHSFVDVPQIAEIRFFIAVESFVLEKFFLGEEEVEGDYFYCNFVEVDEEQEGFYVVCAEGEGELLVKGVVLSEEGLVFLEEFDAVKVQGYCLVLDAELLLFLEDCFDCLEVCEGDLESPVPVECGLKFLEGCENGGDFLLL